MIDDVKYIVVVMDVTRPLVLASCIVNMVIGVATVIIFVRKIVKNIFAEKLMDFAIVAMTTDISMAFAMFRAVKGGRTVGRVVP